MTMTVKFSNEVRDWIAHNLGRGVPASAIVSELKAHRTEPQLAHAMVASVAQALATGAPLPDGKLVLRTRAAEIPTMQDGFVPDADLLPAQPSIALPDRRIRMLARLERPRLALLSDVLSAEECRQLMAAARPRLAASQVVDPTTGKDMAKPHRSSLGMFFRPRETPLVERIEQRIAVLTGHPAGHGEGLQILRYPAGTESTPHFDYLLPSNEANRESLARSGQRVATFILYLNDVPAGGETVFPQAGWSFVPRQGHAVYFQYGNQAGQVDPASLHAGAPVREGEKWIATKWIRNRPFVPRS